MVEAHNWVECECLNTLGQRLNEFFHLDGAGQAGNGLLTALPRRSARQRQKLFEQLIQLHDYRWSLFYHAIGTQRLVMQGLGYLTASVVNSPQAIDDERQLRVNLPESFGSILPCLERCDPKTTCNPEHPVNLP